MTQRRQSKRRQSKRRKSKRRQSKRRKSKRRKSKRRQSKRRKSKRRQSKRRKYAVTGPEFRKFIRKYDVQQELGNRDEMRKCEKRMLMCETRMLMCETHVRDLAKTLMHEQDTPAAERRRRTQTLMRIPVKYWPPDKKLEDSG